MTLSYWIRAIRNNRNVRAPEDSRRDPGEIRVGLIHGFSNDKTPGAAHDLRGLGPGLSPGFFSVYPDAYSFGRTAAFSRVRRTCCGSPPTTVMGTFQYSSV